MTSDYLEYEKACSSFCEYVCRGLSAFARTMLDRASEYSHSLTKVWERPAENPVFSTQPNQRCASSTFYSALLWSFLVWIIYLHNFDFYALLFSFIDFEDFALTIHYNEICFAFLFSWVDAHTSAPAFCSSQLCAMPRLIRIKSAASAVGDHSADAPLSDKTTHKSSQIQIHKECGTTSSLFYPLFGRSWLQSSFAFQSFPIDQKNVWMFKCFSISQLIGWIGACVDKGEINETLQTLR